MRALASVGGTELQGASAYCKCVQKLSVRLRTYYLCHRYSLPPTAVCVQCKHCMTQSVADRSCSPSSKFSISRRDGRRLIDVPLSSSGPQQEVGINCIVEALSLAFASRTLLRYLLAI